MEARKDDKKKGGRPKKTVKKDQLLGVKCSLIERTVITGNAKAAGLTVSEYLRNLGLTGKIDATKKALPKEVLQYNGTLNHIAANLNQIAHKRNRGDDLNALERAKLENDVTTLRQITTKIKSYLQ